MAAQYLIVHPTIDSKSISPTLWGCSPDSISYQSPNEQDKAEYFSWQPEIPWNFTDTEPCPVGRLNSEFPRDEQDQAKYLERSWQSEAPWNFADFESLPAGLSNSYFLPCERTGSERTNWPRPSPLRLSSSSTASSGSYMPETPPLPTSPSEGTNTMPTTPTSAPKRRGRPAHPTQRKTHNEIEAQYRGTINAAIITLQQAVPPPFHGDGASIDDRKRPNFTKAAVMIGAAAYIKHLEAEHRKLVEENNALHAMVAHHRPLPH